MSKRIINIHSNSYKNYNGMNFRNSGDFNMNPNMIKTLNETLFWDIDLTCCEDTKVAWLGWTVEDSLQLARTKTLHCVDKTLEEYLGGREDCELKQPCGPLLLES